MTADSLSKSMSDLHQTGSFGGPLHLKSEVERIDFEDYHAIIIQSKDQADGLPLYGANYYWKNMFLFFSPVMNRNLDAFRKYVESRIKSINCIEIDEDRFVLQGHIYHFKNSESKSNQE